jgi:hypothetical protein
MKLLVVIAHMLAWASVARAQNGSLNIFTPIAEYDSFIQAANNQTATARTIEFECSNGREGGRLMVGGYYVDVDCIPPRYSYYYDKEGTAPRAAQLMIDEVCLTDNPDAFYAELVTSQNYVSYGTAGNISKALIQTMKQLVLPTMLMVMTMNFKHLCFEHRRRHLMMLTLHLLLNQKHQNTFYCHHHLIDRHQFDFFDEPKTKMLLMNSMR